jgi:hypothetical protein
MSRMMTWSAQVSTVYPISGRGLPHSTTLRDIANWLCVRDNFLRVIIGSPFRVFRVVRGLNSPSSFSRRSGALRSLQ